eukprot:530347-Karenia_brevis.AAC.1
MLQQADIYSSMFRRVFAAAQPALLVRLPSAPVTMAPNVPETPVLARGLSQDTVRYALRVRSR